MANNETITITLKKVNITKNLLNRTACDILTNLEKDKLKL
jgi:hypothetical protein